MLRRRHRAMTCLTVALLSAASVARAQSGDGLRYKVRYVCNGEHVVVNYCRHDSDMAGFPRTVPQNDYCSVDFPDQPLHNGLMVPHAILRSQIVNQLQACGALPAPPGGVPQQTGGAAEVMALANRYFEAKDYANALAQYQKALTLTTDPATLAAANLKIGFIYDNANQFDKALPYLREAVRLRPVGGGAFYELGYCYSSLNQPRAALDAFQKSVQLLPNDVSARHWLGSTQVALGQIDDALATYRALQKLNPDEGLDLFSEITKADLDAGEKKPSAEKRAEAYRNLDVPALLAKANHGDDAAMKQLSAVYRAKKDNAESLKWETRAAEAGDPESQNDMGWYYENTSPKNIVEARKWYVKAGSQGYDSAQLNLCRSFAGEIDLDHGVFPGPDQITSQGTIAPLHGNKAGIDAASYWCERAGDRGVVKAAWDAGVLHAKGSQDRSPNYEEAYFWLCYGGIQAGAAFRENVGAHLTAAKRAEVEKLAADFHPDPMTLFHEIMQKNAAHPK